MRHRIITEAGANEHGPALDQDSNQLRLWSQTKVVVREGFFPAASVSGWKAAMLVMSGPRFSGGPLRRESTEWSEGELALLSALNLRCYGANPLITAYSLSGRSASRNSDFPLAGTMYFCVRQAIASFSRLSSLRIWPRA